MRQNFLSWTLLVVVIALGSDAANACTRRGPFSFDEIFAADAILRATPIRYEGDPDLSIMTTGVPKTKVIFRVEEVLSGKLDGVKDELSLNGYLAETDDYNETEVPYHFVRPGGRKGSCFANTYRKGASFLLFVEQTKEGLTTNISAIGSTNEQLRGPDDPWLRWVREEIDRRRKKR